MGTTNPEQGSTMLSPDLGRNHATRSAGGRVI
jgi:hypothetical protein